MVPVVIGSPAFPWLPTGTWSDTTCPSDRRRTFDSQDPPDRWVHVDVLGVVARSDQQVKAEDGDDPCQCLEPDPFGKTVFDHGPGRLTDTRPSCQGRLCPHPLPSRSSHLGPEVNEDRPDLGRLVSQAVWHGRHETRRRFAVAYLPCSGLRLPSPDGDGRGASAQTLGSRPLRRPSPDGDGRGALARPLRLPSPDGDGRGGFHRAAPSGRLR